MYSVYAKDNLKLFVGIVDGDPEKIQHNGVTKMVVTLRDYQGERIKIYFANSEQDSKKKLADRIVNAKVRDGAFLTVLATCSDPEEKTGNGIDFKYRGLWNFKNGDKVTSVLIGPATRPNASKPGQFRVRVPYDEWDATSGKHTVWVDVTFFDSESGGKKRTNATSAQKCMHGEENPMVVITGGEIRDNEYNGVVYHNMVGFRMTRKPE